MLKQLFLIIFFAATTHTAFAQGADTLKKSAADTVPVKKDSVARTSFLPKVKKEKVYHPDSTHSVSRARIRSTIIPGWGQFYNRAYWKIPIIYGALGALGYNIVSNGQQYQRYLAVAQVKRTASIPQPGDALYSKYINNKKLYDDLSQYSAETVASAADNYRRNRDISILGFLLSWGLNIVDAYIDAKFINAFTVDNNLSFKATPGLISGPTYASNFNTPYIPGLKLTFTLR